jgi:hypothetical protein
MCEPVTITATTMWMMAAAGAVVAGAAAYSAKEQGKAQAKTLGEANQLRADQMSKAAGADIMERQRDARRSQGEARAAASESGINLGSNSFLAILQNNAFNADFDNGLITHNTEEAQKGRQSEYKSRLAGISIPTSLGIGLSMAQGGVQGYMAGMNAMNAGTQTAGAGKAG